ncbi:MAG: J domain-containing protein [Lachnospiraceae bacterium]|nr:J domain-containing protein [Lachnospiraceae bacterium]
MSGFSQILEENQKKYTDLIFGEEQIGNIDAIKNTYGISDTEEVLVYAEADRGGTCITDQGVYIHTEGESLPGKNIPFPELCSYFIFQEDSFAAVIAMSKKGEIVLFPKSVGKRNPRGRQLSALLKTLQRNLLSINPTFQNNYDDAIGSVLMRVRTCFSEHGILNVKNQMMLNMVEAEDKFPIDVCYIRAENLYRMCDMARYYAFIEELPGKVNEDLIRRLKSPDDCFFPDYVRDISNPYAFYLTQELLEPYATLRKMETYNEYQVVLMSYLCVRIDDELYLHKILTEYSDAIGEKQLWDIMAFEAKFRNEKMANIYNHILSQDKIGQVEMTWVDSLGLTPLHYALLLRDGKQVKALMEAKDWAEYTPPYSDDELKNLYDFTFLTALLYENPHMQREVFLATSNMAKPLIRAMRNIEQKIYINKQLNRSEDVKEYNRQKEDMEREIRELSAAAVIRARKKAERIRMNGSPFAKFLLKVFDERDSLFQILTGTIADWKVYRFGNRFFITAFDEELPFSYYEWENQSFKSKRVEIGDDRFSWTDEEKRSYHERYEKKEEKEEKTKYHKYSFNPEDDRDAYSYMTPFEGSWFSEAAHYDLTVLKKEYRVLAKKYHPDNSDVPGAKKILQQITTERTNILNSLKK